MNNIVLNKKNEQYVFYVKGKREKEHINLYTLFVKIKFIILQKIEFFFHNNINL